MVLALMLLLWIGGADAFGSCSREPAALRWSVDSSIAKQIGCFNHQFAEHHGYFESIEEFVIEANGKEELLFYDSVNPSKLLFRAPVGRSMQEFLLESKQHGWPSFRDGEVVWENIRVVKGNEVVS
ncbi:hypothetical protein BASA82_000453 [Batrachochytrium salamandrivorans]|nr:hypothetical protein BASA82_000453 [Batrachochytrium salamandrivorans]